LKVHSEGLTALTGEHERREMELEAKYQEKMEQLTAELQLRRKTELHELKERKNTQICTLMKNHEKALHDMKMYYNDITTNSMGLINALKVGIACRNTCSHLICSE
jgi:uncharacterized protein YaiL (DUF2058 family)